MGVCSRKKGKVANKSPLLWKSSLQINVTQSHWGIPESGLFQPRGRRAGVFIHPSILAWRLFPDIFILHFLQPTVWGQQKWFSGQRKPSGKEKQQGKKKQQGKVGLIEAVVVGTREYSRGTNSIYQSDGQYRINSHLLSACSVQSPVLLWFHFSTQHWEVGTIIEILQPKREGI